MSTWCSIHVRNKKGRASQMSPLIEKQCHHQRQGDVNDTVDYCQPNREHGRRRRRKPTGNNPTAATLALLCVTCCYTLHHLPPTAALGSPNSGTGNPPPPPPPPPLPRGGGARTANGGKEAELPRTPADLDGKAAKSAAMAAAAAAASAAAAAADGAGSTTDNCSEAGSTEGSRSSYGSEGEGDDNDDALGEPDIARTGADPDGGQHADPPAGKSGDYSYQRWGGNGERGASGGMAGGEDGAAGRAWRHEDLKQLLQELEDTEIGGYRPRWGRSGSRNAEQDVGAGSNPYQRPLSSSTGPSGRSSMSGRGSTQRSRQQELGGYPSPDSAIVRGASAGAGGDIGKTAAVAGQGLTIAPPPPFPGTHSSATASGSGPKAGSDVAVSNCSAVSDPSRNENDPAVSATTARRLRVRWEWEPEFGNGEDYNIEIAGELRPFQERSRGNDGDDVNGGYNGRGHCEDGVDDDGDEEEDQKWYGVPEPGMYRDAPPQSASPERQQQLLTPLPEREEGAEVAEGAGGGMIDALAILQSGEFSDTGSAGTWTDADTEELHHHGWRDFDHLAAYGYSGRYVPLAGSRVPGSAVHGSGVGGGRRLPHLATSSAAHARSSILDLDYSAKVLDYGRKADVGKPKTLTLRSWGRLAGSASIATAGAFLAVSPNNAPRDEYLALFRRNLGLLAASLLGPAVYSFLLYDWSKANVNTYVRVVTFAFTWGYLITFALEIIVATAFQLAVLALVERTAFNLCPEVPAIFLPWVLKDHNYMPSPLYSCVADLLSFCVGAPIVECAMMVWIVRKLGALPKRTASIPSGLHATAATTSVKKASRFFRGRDTTVGAGGLDAGATARNGVLVRGARPSAAGVSAADEAAAAAAAAAAVESAQEPTHVHTYLLYVLGSAMGLKAACTMQRVLVYTRDYHEHKAFFALARGFFPLYELCGSIIAMNLARREILGDKVNKAQLFIVAVSLNSYAIFRGTKPMFKWAASKPWDELQVKAWVFPSGMTPFQLIRKGFASVAWSLIIMKVAAHVIKTYWRLNRLHSSRLRAQHEAAAIAAAVAEQRAAFALHAATAERGRS